MPENNINCFVYGHCYVAVPADSIADMFCMTYECERCGCKVTI